MKQLPVTILLKMEDGKLVPKRDMDKHKLEVYVKNLQEGDTIQVTYEEQSTDGTYAQISKLQACTRELANHLGYSHEEIKDMSDEDKVYMIRYLVKLVQSYQESSNIQYELISALVKGNSKNRIN